MASVEPVKPASRKENLIDYIHLVSLPAGVVLGGLVVVAVGLRLFFRQSLNVAFPLEKLLLMVLTFSSGALGWREGRFIRVDVLTSRFPERIRVILDVFALLLGLGCYVCLIWLSMQTAITTFRDGNTVAGMNTMPEWPWRLFVPLGLSLLCWEIMMSLIRDIRELTHKKEVVP